ncbi:MAG: hypothetical protein OEV59_00315 [Deltaproteobacteria bacterium]|nr:hypothetical protein [Deltaproteobacteria bacterium]
MYDKDKKAQLIELTGLPHPATGAPLPHIISNDNNLYLAYCVKTENSRDNGTYAIVRFKNNSQYIFGYPNDEAAHQHPLYENGLRPYAAYAVKNSPWIAKHLKHYGSHINTGEPLNKPYMHYIFFFHDTCFECIAEGVETVCVEEGRIYDAVQKINKLIFED